MRPRVKIIIIYSQTKKIFSYDLRKIKGSECLKDTVSA